MHDFFLIAEIKSVYGTEGYVELKSYSDFPERFLNLSKVFVDVFGDKRLFIVEDVISEAGDILVKFKNFDTDEEAAFLTSKLLFVDEKDAVKPGKGTYFIHDLVGSKVYYGETEYGIIKEVMQLASNDVLIIDDLNGGEVLIPFLKKLIVNFSAHNKKLFLTEEAANLYADEDNGEAGNED